MAFTSCWGPSTSAASILFAPEARAFGTNRSRGIDRIAAFFVAGSRCRIITTSLFTPVTPSEQRPKALFCVLRSQRDVEPTRTMFWTPDGGMACRPFTTTWEIWWLRYSTYAMTEPSSTTIAAPTTMLTRMRRRVARVRDFLRMSAGA